VPGVSDRDQRLVPRLMAVLDTIESDAEIVAAVRNLRRIGGPGFFMRNHGEEPDTVSLIDERQEVSVKLRALGGILMRAVGNGFNDTRVRRTAEALMGRMGAGRVRMGDVRVTLAALLDVFRAFQAEVAAAEARASHGHVHSVTMAADNMNPETLRHVMELMSTMMSARRPPGSR
jgi:hypothetical protein